MCRPTGQSFLPCTLCLLSVVTAFVVAITNEARAQSAANSSGHETVITAELRQKCLAVLRDGLKSDEFWPAMHAAEALTIAGQTTEVRQALWPRLTTETDDQHRCGLARELVRAGERFKAQVMLDILAGDNGHGHVHAAESLYKIAEIGDGRLLRRALEQQANPRLQAMAAAALARCGNPKALVAIRQLLRSEAAESRQLAAWILARLGNQSDLLGLREMTRRETAPVNRAYAWFARAALGEAEARQRLQESLGSEDPAIRTYAAEMAGHSRLHQSAEALRALLDDRVLDVRVRAAQSLFLLAQPPAKMPADIARDVYVATAEHPRYSEGSIVRLGDGSLLFATTQFIGGGSDFAAAQIVARRSGDGGQTWSEIEVVQENIGQNNVMSVSLVRLEPLTANGSPLGLFFLRKESASDLKVYLRRSTDEARTFSEPLLVTAADGYHVMNNDRVVRLRSGRMVCPIAWTQDVRQSNHFVSFCYLSDDAGRTWRRGSGQVDLAKRGAMEPGVVELADGRLLMILRTQLGHIYVTRSSDGGETWSEPAAWPVRSPESPATVAMIPATGDLLLVWNDRYSAGANHGGKRTPLVAAVSSDEGASWRFHRKLEDRTDQTYAYTSLAFDQDRVLLSYYVRDEQSGRISSRFRSLPLASFYESK